MKTVIIAALMALQVLDAPAEDSYRGAKVREIMKNIGWVTDGVIFQELDRVSPTILIKRDEQLVGYYTEEIVWRKTEHKPIDLSGVTAIVFGQSISWGPGGPVIQFKIEESAEIAVWVAAYIEHTESKELFAVFIPTAKNAGFERLREKMEFGGAYGDTCGLRFYAGERMILELPGHLELESEITPGGIRNEVLHEFTKAKIATLSAEDSQSKQTEVEQDGAGQPATRSESK